jgi:WD40 repeat protein
VIINNNGAPTTDLLFTADSKTLVLGGQHMPRFFEVATGKEQELVGGGHRGSLTAMIATDVGYVSRGAENVLRVWNAQGKEVRQFGDSANTSTVRFAPDGKSVAIGGNDGAVKLINLDDGKQIKQIKAHESAISAIAFAADGTRFATRGHYDGTLRVFDTAKGTQLKEITYLDVKAGAGAGNALVIVRTLNGQRDGNPLAFSPDGKTLATFIAPQQVYVQGRQQIRPDSNCLCLYDVATGKEVRRIPMTDGRIIHQLTYSLDGRLLISENVDKTVSFWEIASGQERSRIGSAVNTASQAVATSFVAVGGAVRSGPAIAPIGATIAVSPDGSLVAVPGSDKTIKVFDAYAGKEITSLNGHNGAVTALEFSPDGKKLLSGSTDTTLLVWDVTRLKREPRPQIAKLDAKDLDTLWTELIGSDAVKAGESIKKLIAAANVAVAHLNAHVEPAVGTDGARVDQWIRDLDSTNFKKRAAAAKELDKLGELAIPALQKALAERPSLEIRRRLEPMLDNLTGSILTPEQIRVVRAIEVLDKIGTPLARQALERLAGGAAGSLTTRQAQSVLERQSKK